jgi:hypothetical protein
MEKGMIWQNGVGVGGWTKRHEEEYLRLAARGGKAERSESEQKKFEELYAIKFKVEVENVIEIKK